MALGEFASTTQADWAAIATLNLILLEGFLGSNRVNDWCEQPLADPKPTVRLHARPPFVGHQDDRGIPELFCRALLDYCCARETVIPGASGGAAIMPESL